MASSSHKANLIVRGISNQSEVNDNSIVLCTRQGIMYGSLYAGATHVTHARQHISKCCCSPTSGRNFQSYACPDSATFVLHRNVNKHQPHPTHKDNYVYTQAKGTRPCKIVPQNSTLSRNSVQRLPASLPWQHKVSNRCVRFCLPSHTKTAHPERVLPLTTAQTQHRIATSSCVYLYACMIAEAKGSTD
jgi:hypothetical protein